MTWLILRLHRTTLLLAAATTALAVAALAAYRLLAVNTLTAAGVPQSCIADPTFACREQALTILAGPDGEDILRIVSLWGPAQLVLLAVPLVLGLLTGAGMIARELGRDTHLLTLTQNLGRARWWVGRLSLAAGVAVVGTVLVCAVAGWAIAPLDRLVGWSHPLSTPVFENSGLVPAGHALLACALGAVLALLTRNAAVAAFVTTLAYGLVLFGLTSTEVRGAYLPPVTVTTDAYTGEASLGSPPGVDDWVLERRYLDANGDVIPRAAMHSADGCVDFDDCLRAAGVVAEEEDFQPASRYWPIQLIETAVLLALAGCAVTVGSLRLRRSLVP